MLKLVQIILKDIPKRPPEKYSQCDSGRCIIVSTNYYFWQEQCQIQTILYFYYTFHHSISRITYNNVLYLSSYWILFCCTVLFLDSHTQYVHVSTYIMYKVIIEKRHKQWTIKTRSYCHDWRFFRLKYYFVHVYFLVCFREQKKEKKMKHSLYYTSCNKLNWLLSWMKEPSLVREYLSHRQKQLKIQRKYFQFAVDTSTIKHWFRQMWLFNGMCALSQIMHGKWLLYGCNVHCQR